MRPPRSTHAVTLGLVLAALAPATAMAGQDLRSPDARDPFTAPASATDLRAPDTRDAADGRSASGSPSVLVVRLGQHRSASSGMDWGDAGIGAGGALVVLALAGGTVAVQRRRHVGSARAAV
jgi:hypothetical protein